MFARIYNGLAIVAVATLISTGGIAGWLALSGRLNATRIESIAAILRGESLASPAGPGVVAASQPVDAPMSPGAPTAEEVRAARKREHLESLRLERARRDLDAQKRLLDQSLHHLVTEQEALTKSQSEFAGRRKKLIEADRDAGFQRELQYVAGLPPKQAKDHIVRTWEKQRADAVRLFMKLDVNKGKRILEQFKTPEELATMHDLLEQVRLQDNETDAESGTTKRDTTP